MTQLLRDIFNYDFRACPDAEEFQRRFFSKRLTLADLKKTCAVVSTSRLNITGKTIPAAIHIEGKSPGKPFIILAQLHGNEPAGLAAILLALALKEAGRLERSVIGAVGNPLAALQYFEAWQKNPEARQETRDAYRCGLDESGNLLPDMNRIPVDFLAREPSTPHIKRAQELYALAQHSCGIADIHSARGNMVCITDHKHDSDLKCSPIRAVLTGLAEAISAHASAAVSVQTLKTILTPMENIECQIGIEAGRHESKGAPEIAASFTLSLLHTLGMTSVPPLMPKETGLFERYAVRPKITYGDLVVEGALQPGDKITMGREVNGIFTAGQYEEMEAIEKNQVVARAEPSGVRFRAPFAFSGIFFSKSATLYDKDPSVGPWPVAVDQLGATKFCYPCDVSEITLPFS